VLQKKQEQLLIKQISLFSSNHDGEVLAAISAANRTLKSANIDWVDLARNLGEEKPYGSPESSAATYEAGFNAGFRHAADILKQQNTPNHRQMLAALKQKSSKLNAWGKEFVLNLQQNSSWKLTDKQKACIERLYNQHVE
jgi:hypothetical protein